MKDLLIFAWSVLGLLIAHHGIFVWSIRQADTYPSLLLANDQDVLLLQVQPMGSANSTIIRDNVENAEWVDYYFADQIVFFSDSSSSEDGTDIYSMTLKPRTSPRPIISSVGRLSGLACDWLGLKLYFIDSLESRIEVCEFDGTSRKVIVWEKLRQPRDVVVDPDSGYMFWADWDPDLPKIERASLSGDQRTTIIENSLARPYCLTFDRDSMQLYWADTQLHHVMVSDYFGYSQRVLFVEVSQRITSLSIFGERLYWVDQSASAVASADKVTGQRKKLEKINLNSPSSLRVFSETNQQQRGPNPCADSNGRCSDLCLLSPTPPFYSCACPTGVKMVESNNTCQSRPESFVIFSTLTDIQMISLDTTDHIPQIITQEGIVSAIGLDFDPVEEYIYWTDDILQSIQRVKLDGTGREIIISHGLEVPDGIAVDWIGRNLYWTDTGTNKIEVSQLDGSLRRTIIARGLDEPRAIAVDPERGYLYWSDWGRKSKIERSALDGTNRSTIINTPNGWPNGLAIDLDEGRILWGMAKYKRIETADLTGSDRNVVVDNTKHVFGFSLAGDRIYWTDWNTQTIESAHKTTGEDRVIIAKMPNLMGLKAVNMESYLGFGNPCSISNGGCSHMCLYRPGGAICICPPNMELTRSDYKTCIFPGPTLIYWADGDIRRLHLENRIGKVNNILPVDSRIGEIDTDSMENRVYWSDLGTKTINRAFINGTGVETIIGSDITEPIGIAIDWIARIIYFADAGRASIELSRLDGSGRRSLIVDRISAPHSIAVDPLNGYLFWSDWGNIPTIERSALDGTQRTLVAINCPSSYLVADAQTQRLYWVVPDANRIESSTYTGKGKQLITERRIKRPTSLSIFNNYLIFANSRSNSIEMVDKVFGANRTVLKKNQQDVTGFALLHASYHFEESDNPCGVNNGDCEYFCFAKKDRSSESWNRKCDCPKDLVLNTEKGTCSEVREYMLAAHQNMFQRIHFDQSLGSKDMLLPIKLSEREDIKAIEYDPVDRYIYWIDSNSRTVKRAPEEGMEAEIFMDNNTYTATFNPFDIAIEPYNRLLFVSDTACNCIVSKMISRGDKIMPIFHEPGEQPRFLAIKPERGELIWTDAKSRSPKIIMGRLDASRQVVMHRVFDPPGGIALDMKSHRLFWKDVSSDSIRICNSENSFRKSMIMSCPETSMTTWRKQSRGAKKNFQLELHCGIAVEADMIGSSAVSSLTVYKMDIFWVDKDHNRIAKRDMYGRGKVLTFRENLPGLSDIEVVLGDVEESHPCYNRGPCSHICLISDSKEAECVCPEGLILDHDAVTCVEPAGCSSSQFQCPTGNVHCIPIEWVCDRIPECEDGADEIGCSEQGNMIPNP